MCTPHVLPRHAPLCAELEGDDTTGGVPGIQGGRAAHQNESRRMGRGSVMHGGAPCGARRHGRRRPRPPLCLWQHRGALPDQDPGLQGQRHPGRRPPFSTHTTKVGQGTGGRLRRRSSHQDSALIENGCDRGSRGPRASADGIRMYTGPVSWVSKSNQCCEGCYSRVVCIHN